MWQFQSGHPRLHFQGPDSRTLAVLFVKIEEDDSDLWANPRDFLPVILIGTHGVREIAWIRSSIPQMIFTGVTLRSSKVSQLREVKARRDMVRCFLRNDIREVMFTSVRIRIQAQAVYRRWPKTLLGHLAVTICIS